MKSIFKVKILVSVLLSFFALSCGKDITFRNLAIEDPGNGDDDKKVTSCPSAALGEDPYVKYSAGHAITIFGTPFTNLVFDKGAKFIEDPATGTATLTGVVRMRTDSTKAFDVNITLTGRTSSPPVDSPKKELKAIAYVEDGGIVDTSTWHYYTETNGTLTGKDDLVGTNITLVRKGPAFQVGKGSNGKNANPGASGWFDWTGTGLCAGSGSGDFNLDLDECPCASGVPPIGV